MTNEQEPRFANIIDAVDALDTANLLLKAGFMACNDIAQDAGAPLQTVLCAARDKLAQARAKLLPKETIDD